MLTPGIPFGLIKEDKTINLNEHFKKSVIYDNGINNLQYSNQIIKENKNKPFSLNDVHSDILIKEVLFFLDINSLPKFSMSNKKCNESVKTHVFLRLYSFNKDKKLMENQNSHLIKAIELKRKNFFEEYEMNLPNKENACKLMNSLSFKDIIELRQFFKKSNKNNDNFIAPLVILMGLKVKSIF